VSEQRCASVSRRACAAQQHKTATHAHGACGRHGSARRVRQRVEASAWAQQHTILRAAACGSASRQRARCGERASASLAGRKQQLLRARCAHGSCSARAHRQRHGLQVAAAAFCASVGRSPPARANVSASRKRGALGEYCSPAHCTTRGALAHLGLYCDCAQKPGCTNAKAGARRAGGAPPLLRTSVFGSGAVGERATAAKMRAAGSANTRAAGSGSARRGVESWRRGGVFRFLSFLLVRR
jgi:hypothetical protein